MEIAKMKEENVENKLGAKVEEVSKKERQLGVFKCSRCGEQIGNKYICSNRGYGIQKSKIMFFFLLKKEEFFPNEGTIRSSKGLDKYEVIGWDTAAQ